MVYLFLIRDHRLLRAKGYYRLPFVDAFGNSLVISIDQNHFFSSSTVKFIGEITFPVAVGILIEKQFFPASFNQYYRYYTRLSAMSITALLHNTLVAMLDVYAP